eukprot:Hpha_TRINITY_DN15515_c1_g4::TRINITY_DN15515_c1_g4_i2::g.106029::m.106029
MGVVFGKISQELPRYAEVAKTSTYQVRLYQPAVAVVTNYTREWGDGADGQPFGALAKYIGVFSTPQNAPETPIAMTAPVLIDRASEMIFMLPASKYPTLESAPEPSNPNVRLKMLPERLQAVRTFSGNLNPDSARSERDILLAELQRDGWIAKDGEWQAAGYNAPYVLPWCKTNEVLIGVEPKEGVDASQ